VPPFLFTKGPESTFFNEATLRLTCPIAGADFVGKLIAPDAAAKAAGNDQNNPTLLKKLRPSVQRRV
jgi:hypothetical protein